MPHDLSMTIADIRGPITSMVGETLGEVVDEFYESRRIWGAMAPPLKRLVDAVEKHLQLQLEALGREVIFTQEMAEQVILQMTLSLAQEIHPHAAQA